MSDEQPTKGYTRRVVGIGLVVAFLALMLALVGGQQFSESRALARIPPDQRAEIFAGELEVFQSLCGGEPRQDGLEAECRDKAVFVLRFPECDQACQRLARGHLSVSPR